MEKYTAEHPPPQVWGRRGSPPISITLRLKPIRRHTPQNPPSNGAILAPPRPRHPISCLPLSLPGCFMVGAHTKKSHPPTLHPPCHPPAVIPRWELTCTASISTDSPSKSHLSTSSHCHPLARYIQCLCLLLHFVRSYEVLPGSIRANPGKYKHRIETLNVTSKGSDSPYGVKYEEREG